MLLGGERRESLLYIEEREERETCTVHVGTSTSRQGRAKCSGALSGCHSGRPTYFSGLRNN